MPSRFADPFETIKMEPSLKVGVKASVMSSTCSWPESVRPSLSVRFCPGAMRPPASSSISLRVSFSEFCADW